MNDTIEKLVDKLGCQISKADRGQVFGISAGSLLVRPDVVEWIKKDGIMTWNLGGVYRDAMVYIADGEGDLMGGTCPQDVVEMMLAIHKADDSIHWVWLKDLI